MGGCIVFYKRKPLSPVRPSPSQLVLWRTCLHHAENADVPERKWWRSDMLGPTRPCQKCPRPPPSRLVHFALTFCGPGAGARWQRAWRSEQLGCQHRSPDQHRWQAQQGWIPEPHVSQVLRRSPHVETCRQDSIVMFLQELPHMHIWFSAHLGLT